MRQTPCAFLPNHCRDERTRPERRCRRGIGHVQQGAELGWSVASSGSVIEPAPHRYQSSGNRWKRRGGSQQARAHGLNTVRHQMYFTFTATSYRPFSRAVASSGMEICATTGGPERGTLTKIGLPATTNRPGSAPTG